MNEDELKALEKQVKKCKRIASERASELHDLVEDRLPAAYDELPDVAQATFEACRAWDDARNQLEQARGEV